MKCLLVAINAKYIHANAAVRSLRAYAGDLGQLACVKEYTINQYVEDILADIYREKPDIVAFSCYIWNIAMVEELTELLHRIDPDLPIWYGGPEVSFDSTDCLRRNPGLKGVIRGEGEAAFKELLGYYAGLPGAGNLYGGELTPTLVSVPVSDSDPACGRPKSSGSPVMPEQVEDSKTDLAPEDKALCGIRGITFRREDGAIVENPARPLLSMDALPFIYEDMSEFEHKIIYYETSRGCPFSCSYCLSSIKEPVRLRSMDLVEKELQFFIDHRVPQVKFVDRTFNCNKAHAFAIWRYILEHDRGFTNFHFEIGADLLDEEALEILGRMRPGLVQLEIGVQSTNEAAICEVSRTMDLDRLKAAVLTVNASKNIHQHLDLIAGLPFEDYQSFARSFDAVYALAPDQLQLGFLKVLKGSRMHRDAELYNIIYSPKAPYEVLKTRWLTYGDLIRLKGVEEMVEVYYNSRQFERTLAYMLHFYESPFAFYEDLAAFYEERGIGKALLSRMQRYDILLEFAGEKDLFDRDLIMDLMTVDLYARENLKSRPVWMKEKAELKNFREAFYMDEEKIRAYLPGYGADGYNGRQIMRMTHMAGFDHDPDLSAKAGERRGGPTVLVFDYRDRNPLNGSARITHITKG